MCMENKENKSEGKTMMHYRIQNAEGLWWASYDWKSDKAEATDYTVALVAYRKAKKVGGIIVKEIE